MSSMKRTRVEAEFEDMADKDIKLKSKIIRDPALAKNRIFVGNLPVCTREELESICYPYGKVLGSLVQKNFGFVQFESQEIANKVAQSLTKSTFKGNIITVRNAGAKATPKRPFPPNQMTPQNVPQTVQQYPGPPGPQSQQLQDMGNEYNDCEIIVVDRRNTKYAEYIEDRLRRINMRVDVLFPNLEVGLGKVLSSIASRGCLYAVLVTKQHEEHNSITINVLRGMPTEHRNMPLEEAIQLITDDFRKYERVQNQPQVQPILPKPVAIIPVSRDPRSFTVERHPDGMQTLINLLGQNMPLTVLQYDHVIKYLQQRRSSQLKVELGAPQKPAQPKKIDPQILLQKKIRDILNKPSVAGLANHAKYSNIEESRDDPQLMELLREKSVRDALDTVLDSRVMKTIANTLRLKGVI